MGRVMVKIKVENLEDALRSERGRYLHSRLEWLKGKL
jgi:hypothetical protein